MKLMKVFIVLVAVVPGAFFSACMSSDPEPGRTVPVPSVVAGGDFLLDLQPGPAYEARVGWWIFGYTVYPQVAVWLEDSSGKFLGTLLVTRKASSGQFLSAPEAGRPEALPVWTHRKEAGAGKAIDAVSAATEAGPTLKAAGLAGGLAPGRYTVWLETNRSYDYNQTWTQANSGVNGQPSLVCQAVFDLGGDGQSADLVPVGTGDVDGRTGEVRRGLSGLDTALDLFSVMKVTWRKP